jgi:hypothetical protein
MNIPRRVFSLLALFLGLIGLIGCIALAVGVWIGGARLTSTTENLFGKIDDAFVAVRERVLRTQARVQESRITTEGVKQSLRNWSKQEAGERLASRLHVKEKTERLAHVLGQADRWLELSASSTETVRLVLSIGSEAGVPTNKESADRLLEGIGSLRGQLAQARELVAKIGKRTGDANEEQTLKERIDQAVDLALRLLTTLSSLDSRLAQLEGRVSEIQQEAQQWKTTTLRWILIATSGVSLLIAWMALGQFVLCLDGGKGMRRG